MTSRVRSYASPSFRWRTEKIYAEASDYRGTSGEFAPFESAGSWNMKNAVRNMPSPSKTNDEVPMMPPSSEPNDAP